jgi:hypothetical protein
MQRLVLKNVHQQSETQTSALDHANWDVGALLQQAHTNTGTHTIVVGRNDAAEVKIDSSLLPAMISRSHAEMELDVDGEGVYLTDRQSMNGTWYAAKPQARHENSVTAHCVFVTRLYSAAPEHSIATSSLSLPACIEAVLLPLTCPHSSRCADASSRTQD